jgi:hypothetical protein
MVSRLPDEVEHRLWLQGPFNYLGSKRRVSYFVAIFRKILGFLYI